MAPEPSSSHRLPAGNSSFVLVLFGTATVLLVLQGLIFRWRRYLRLQHIPGPPTAGWSRLWLLRQALGGECHKAFSETNEKYGPIAKVGPYHVLTSDPDLIRRINAARTPYKRSEWYKAVRFDPDKDNLATCSPEKHLELRAKMAAGYSGKEVDGVESKIDKNIFALVRLLETRYIATNCSFDFGRKAQYFTLDVISDLAYGDPFGFLDEDADQYSYIQIAEGQFSMFLTLTIYPWIISFLSSPLLRSLLPTDQDLVGFGKFMGIVKEKATIRSILLLIITTPRVHAALLSEIAALTPALTADQVISDERARKLPYLQAVIKEGLRWFPPVTGMLSKQVPPSGDEWKGVRLPPGTLVGFSAWGVMRARHFWGDDAAEFRPERWLEVPLERLREMEATLGLTFGYGKWHCLGKEVALIELNKVFVEASRA
ncbi:hypothetical protein VDGE_30535 [Verticillium dahliae]|uniref:Pisatin demethylase n=1 Tax=Verticillium dahliae TaxID=27337 RepID=A0A444RKM9_VERDA|nr:hypothetical protein VDGE_30535 [Verticillium dahliae]